jgi:hypothetical protein
MTQKTSDNRGRIKTTDPDQLNTKVLTTKGCVALSTINIRTIMYETKGRINLIRLPTASDVVLYTDNSIDRRAVRFHVGGAKCVDEAFNLTKEDPLFGTPRTYIETYSMMKKNDSVVVNTKTKTALAIGEVSSGTHNAYHMSPDHIKHLGRIYLDISMDMKNNRYLRLDKQDRYLMLTEANFNLVNNITKDGLIRNNDSDISSLVSFSWTLLYVVLFMFCCFQTFHTDVLGLRPVVKVACSCTGTIVINITETCIDLKKKYSDYKASKEMKKEEADEEAPLLVKTKVVATEIKQTKMFNLVKDSAPEVALPKFKSGNCVDKVFGINSNEVKFGEPRTVEEVISMASDKGMIVVNSNMKKIYIGVASDFKDPDEKYELIHLTKNHVEHKGSVSIIKDGKFYNLSLGSSSYKVTSEHKSRFVKENYSSDDLVEAEPAGHSLKDKKSIDKLRLDINNLNSTIDIATYNKIIEVVPARITAKLRLLFDKNLPARMEHLEELLRISRDGIYYKGDKYDYIDIEGMLGVSAADMADITLISKGKLLFVDITSDPKLEIVKDKKMKDALSSGSLWIDRRLLNSADDMILTEDPITDAISLTFMPMRKFDVDITNKIHREKDECMMFSDKFEDMYNSSSESAKKDFDDICKDVSRQSAYDFMDNLMSKPGFRCSNEDRKVIASMSDKILECLTSNGIETATIFESILNNLRLIKDKEIQKAINYYDYTLSNVNVKDRLVSKIRIPELSNASFEDKLESLSAGNNIAWIVSKILSVAEGTHVAIRKDGKIESLDDENTKKMTRNDLQPMNCVNDPYVCYSVKTGSRTFKAFFNENYMHDNFGDYVRRRNNPEFGNTGKEDLYKTCTMKDLEVKNSLTLDKLLDTNDRKITDYKSLESVKVLSTLLNKSITKGPDDIQKTFLENNGSYLVSNASISASHDSVESKGLAISAKIGSRGPEYFVADNKPFNSITLIKKGADVSHLNTIWYQTIYKDEEGNMMDGGYRSKSRNDMTWNIKLPYVMVSLFDYAKECGTTDRGAMTDCMISMINRDPATVMMLKSRYIYMAIRGEKSKPAAIFSKAIDINKKPIFKSSIENLYMVRMIKMFVCGWCMNMTVHKIEVSAGKMIKAFRTPDICLPNMESSLRDYNYHISSFYVARAFNKYRTEKLSSDSENYVALIEELEIFNETKRDRPTNIYGVDIEALGKETLIDLTNHVRNNKTTIVDGIVDMMTKGPSRYTQNFYFSHACILTLREDFKNKEVDAIKAIFEKNVSETFTLRGAMEAGRFTGKNQAVRAASAMFEHILDKRGDAMDKNMNIWQQMNKMTEKGDGLCSLYTLKSQQMIDALIEYLARIISKDQDGNREITVMNAEMRIGCKFCEAMMEISGALVKENIMMNNDKEKLFMAAYNDTIIGRGREAGTSMFDTNDQSRWGPNQMMNMFSHMASVLIGDKYCRMMFIDSMHLMSKKKNKWPESLLKQFSKMEEKLMGLHQMNTIYGIAYDKYRQYSTSTAEYHVEMPMGMGQGILGTTSSIMHSAVCRWQSEFLEKQLNVKMTVYVTSDDSFCALSVPSEVTESGFTQDVYVNFRSGTLSAMNVLRNSSKSFVSGRDAEVNSMYIIEGDMVAPVARFRSALIDCGDGLNYYNDSMAAVSRGAEYIRKGGSIYGSYVISAINVALLLDQWRRFSYYEKNSSAASKPLEFGGSPIIQPICTMCFGPLSSTAVKMADLGIQTSTYAQVISNSMLSPVESISNKEMIMSALPSFNSDYYMPKSMDGIFNYNKFYKYEAVVEKRNSLSQMEFGFGEYPIEGTVMSVSDTLNYVRNRFKTKMLNDKSGHDFIDRMFEPAYSRNRETIRLDGNTLVTEALELGYSRMSLDDLESKLDNLDMSSIALKGVYASYLSKFDKTSETINSLTEALGVAFSNAINVSKSMDLFNTRKQPVTKSVQNVKKQLPSVSAVLVNEKDVKLGVISTYSGKLSVRYAAAYGYNVESHSNAKGSINESLLRAESVMHAVNKHVLKGLKIFNKISPSSSLYTTMIDDLLSYNYFSGHGLSHSGISDIKTTERLFALSDSLREASNDSITYLSKYNSPGLKQSEAVFKPLNYVSVAGDLTHSSTLVKSDEDIMTKHISTMKDVVVYRNVLAANNAEVTIDTSLLMFISSVKASRAGYMGITTNSHSVQGVAKWTSGKNSGNALVVSSRHYKFRRMHYTTTIYLGGTISDDVSLTFSPGTIKSKSVASILDKINRKENLNTRTDTVKTIRLSYTTRCNFSKMGDMYYLSIGDDSGNKNIVPIMRDYDSINASPDFKMRSYYSNQADEMVERVTEEKVDTLEDMINLLSDIETTPLLIDDAVTKMVSITRKFLSVSRRSKLVYAKDYIKKYVSMRTMTREFFFKNESKTVIGLDVEEDPEEDGEEDEDTEMLEFLTMIASSKATNIFDETSEVPSSAEIAAAIERRHNRNIGGTAREVLRAKIDDITTTRDVEEMVQFMLSNTDRYDINYLFWLCVDFMVNS